MRPAGAEGITSVIRAAHDELRSSGNALDTAQVVSVLLLLKWASDRPGDLEVPEPARWTHVMERVDYEPGKALDDALQALVGSNESLLGNLYWFSDFTRRLSQSTVAKLIALFDRISLGAPHLEFGDEVGRAYDEALGALGVAAGKKGGEFSTPRSVSRLMVRLGSPESGQSIYDPCAGSGGSLIAAVEYLRERSLDRGQVNVYAQEINATTCAIARLNLLFHGIWHGSVRCGDVLADPLHVAEDGRLIRFDRVLTVPPFSMNYRRDVVRFPERMRYGWTPENGKKADLMFVQHVLATLKPDGVGVVVLPNGVLFRGGAEAGIRRGITLDGRLVAVIGIGPNVFQGASVPACVLVLRGRGKSARSADGDVLFINAEREISTGRTRNYLAPRHIEKIADVYREKKEIPGFSRLVPIGEIEANDFNLNIRRYLDLDDDDQGVVPDPQALLYGGVPDSEIEAQRERFRAFGVDLETLFAPSGSGRRRFTSQAHETSIRYILSSVAASEDNLVHGVSEWVHDELESLLMAGDVDLRSGRDLVLESFRRNFLPLGMLDEYQIAGIFADWWSDRADDLRVLRDALRRETGDAAPSGVDGVGAVLNVLTNDLVLHLKKVTGVERQRLANVYRSWVDQYGTSLLDLEKERETTTKRLQSRLQGLGYRWPDNAT